MIRLSGFSRSLRARRVQLAGVVVAAISLPSAARTWAQASPRQSHALQQSPDPVSQPLKELKEVKDIFDRAKKAVVKIHGVDEHSDIYGTGFFIDPTGTLYTSYTVAGEAENFTIEFDGKQYPARQILADSRSGIALLKADAMTPVLAIAKTEQLEVATPVLTVGYPLDLPESPSFGMIAGFDRKYLGHYLPTTHLRVNLSIQRGEAGAPLLNLKGEVVGIIVARLESSSACYALPIAAAEKIRNDFVRFGEVRHGWIGAEVGEAKDTVEGSRTIITDILGAVTASDSAVRPGDILLQVGQVSVHEPEDVIDASFYLTAGDTVPITVIREGKKITLNVEADFHPMSPRQPPLLSTWPSSMLNRGIPLNLQSTPQGDP